MKNRQGVDLPVRPAIPVVDVIPPAPAIRFGRDKAPAGKIVSLATAVKDFVAGGFVLSGVAVAAERLAVCRACDQFRQRTHVCGVCGCFMPAKVYIAGESCPAVVPKWGPAVESS